jgi:hypothetical protein
MMRLCFVLGLDLHTRPSLEIKTKEHYVLLLPPNHYHYCLSLFSVVDGWMNKVVL